MLSLKQGGLMKLTLTIGTSLVLIAIGISLIVIGAATAYSSFLQYTPVLPKSSSLSEAITNTAYELVNLVAKLAFLGLVIWSGGISLKYGLNALIQFTKPIPKSEGA